MISPVEIQSLRWRQKINKRWGAALLLMLTSCATEQYRYLPTSVGDQNIENSQKRRAFYQIPAKDPTGTVRIVSGGIVQLKRNEGGSGKIPTLNIRMVFSNQKSESAWVVNPREQYVILQNEVGKFAPIFYQSSISPSVDLKINREEMRTLDLYFALPENKKTAKEIPEFEFRWQVQAGETQVTETTSFYRTLIDSVYMAGYPYSVYPYYAYPYGYPEFGPYSPFGPDYGWGQSTFFVAPLGPPSKPVITSH